MAGARFEIEMGVVFFFLKFHYYYSHSFTMRFALLPPFNFIRFLSGDEV